MLPAFPSSQPRTVIAEVVFPGTAEGAEQIRRDNATRYLRSDVRALRGLQKEMDRAPMRAVLRTRLQIEAWRVERIGTYYTMGADEPLRRVLALLLAELAPRAEGPWHVAPKPREFAHDIARNLRRNAHLTRMARGSDAADRAVKAAYDAHAAVSA